MLNSTTFYKLESKVRPQMNHAGVLILALTLVAARQLVTEDGPPMVVFADVLMIPGGHPYT